MRAHSTTLTLGNPRAWGQKRTRHCSCTFHIVCSVCVRFCTVPPATSRARKFLQGPVLVLCMSILAIGGATSRSRSSLGDGGTCRCAMYDMNMCSAVSLTTDRVSALSLENLHGHVVITDQPAVPSPTLSHTQHNSETHTPTRHHANHGALALVRWRRRMGNSTGARSPKNASRTT
jgi:hypothetical protein